MITSVIYICRQKWNEKLLQTNIKIKTVKDENQNKKRDQRNPLDRYHAVCPLKVETINAFRPECFYHHVNAFVLQNVHYGRRLFAKRNVCVSLSQSLSLCVCVC